MGHPPAQGAPVRFVLSKSAPKNHHPSYFGVFEKRNCAFAVGHSGGHLFILQNFKINPENKRLIIKDLGKNERENLKSLS